MSRAWAGVLLWTAGAGAACLALVAPGACLLALFLLGLVCAIVGGATWATGLGRD